MTNDFEFNFDPAWSPDGSRIAFVKRLDLWVVNADGSGATKIFGAPDVVNSGPSWSPDGSKIAFWSAGELQYDIYTLNEDGSNLVRLTTDPEVDAQPAWSPDGTKIAFSSQRSTSYEIYVMNADGSGQVQLTHNGGVAPAWSPDGSKIAFNRGGLDDLQDIFTIDIDGTNEVNLTNSPTQELAPDWQPLQQSPTPTEPPSPTPTQGLSPTESPAPTQTESPSPPPIPSVTPKPTALPIVLPATGGQRE